MKSKNIYKLVLDTIQTICLAALSIATIKFLWELAPMLVSLD